MNILKILFSFFFIGQVFAANEYTSSEVSIHNSTSDCWVVYEDSVYDLTEYLPLHDRYQNIRSWCGKNMTEDFETKDGLGVDHKSSSYALLEQYYIGDLVVAKPNNQEENTVSVSSNSNTVENIDKQEANSQKITASNPYNLLLPLILTTLLYWIPYFFVKNKTKFNAFWNTVLLLTLLIPSFGFGIFMILRYQFPDFYNIDFKFMYWHVELSVVMGVIAISHLIQRLKLYLVQLKK